MRIGTSRWQGWTTATRSTTSTCRCARLAGPACLVTRDLRVYCDSDDLRDFHAPDVLVAFGVPHHVREHYLIPDEGKAPDLVIEVFSRTSLADDLDKKLDWYRGEGVREYVLVDPLGRFAPQPRLQAWRFRDADGHLLEPATYERPAPDGMLASQVVPFGWRVIGDWVRVIDLATGEVAATPLEALARLVEAEAQLREEIRARQEAEERATAEEQARAAEATARAQEAAARRRAEGEIERLRADLERLRGEQQG